MRPYFFTFIFFIQTLHLSAQQKEVSWEVFYIKEGKELCFRATLAPGWHLYSQYVDNEIGPVPTSFVYKPNDKIKLIGSVTEPKAISKYDENFEATLAFFEEEVVFKQPIEILGPTIMEGIITFMLCNETMCLPPVEKVFEIQLNQ